MSGLLVSAGTALLSLSTAVYGRCDSNAHALFPCNNLKVPYRAVLPYRHLENQVADVRPSRVRAPARGRPAALRLPAYPCDNGAPVRVSCPYCGREHYHGVAVLGHRLAHCGAGAGYVLTVPKKLERCK